MTKVLFDTSALVAALSGAHVDHTNAFVWLERVLTDELTGCVSAHALAELYSVMTGQPQWRVPPRTFVEGFDTNFQHFEVVSLNKRDYRAAMQRMADLKLPGGGIYDALHAQAALKAEADTLLTLNSKHFTRLGDDIARLVQEP